MAANELATISRSQRHLVASNATDAAGRSLSDITIELLFVGTLGASAMQMGLLNTLGSLAFVLCAIPAGHWVDRYSALRMLRIGLSGKITLLLCLMVLAFSGQMSIGIGLLLCTLLGACNVFSETAQTSAVPRIIGADPKTRTASISKLIARLSAADQSMTVIIPALAGTGFTLLGAPALLGVSLALAIFALLLAVRIRPHLAGIRESSNVAEARAGTKGKREVFAGVSHLLQHRELRMTTLVVGLSNLGLAMGSSVEAIFIIKDLGFGEFGFGLYASLAGVGGLIGALLASRVVGRYSAQKLLFSMTLAQMVLVAVLIVAAFTNEFWSIALVALHALGWGSATLLFNVSASSWLVEIVPEKLLGRVLSARRLFTFGAIPLGSLLGGVLGSGFGTVVALTGWGVAALAALLCCSWSMGLRPRR